MTTWVKKAIPISSWINKAALTDFWQRSLRYLFPVGWFSSPWFASGWFGEASEIPPTEWDIESQPDTSWNKISPPNTLWIKK